MVFFITCFFVVQVDVGLQSHCMIMVLLKLLENIFVTPWWIKSILILCWLTTSESTFSSCSFWWTSSSFSLPLSEARLLSSSILLSDSLLINARSCLPSSTHHFSKYSSDDMLCNTVKCTSSSSIVCHCSHKFPTTITWLKVLIPVFLNYETIDNFLKVFDRMEPNAARNSSLVKFVHPVFVASSRASAW